MIAHLDHPVWGGHSVECGCTACSDRRHMVNGHATIPTVATTGGLPPGSTASGVALPTRYGDPRFYALLENIAELHSRKNHDYAQTGDPLSNLRMSEAFGIPAWKGTLVRISDKWSRLVQLAAGKTPKNESLRDTLLDLAVYSLLCILLLEES